MDYNPLLWRGDDARFALDTLRSSYCLADISKIVAARTSEETIQNLAYTMAHDQEKMFRQLRGMARTINFHVPSKRELEDCPQTARLRELEGTELEKSYVTLLAKTAADDVSRFEAETGMPREPWNWSLWKFAQKTLPITRENESAVKAAQRKLAEPKK